MDAHALSLLEFERVVGLVSEYAISERGKRLIAEQEILADRDKISEFHSAVACIRYLLASGEKLPHLHLNDITPCYPRLSKPGTFLEAYECTEIGLYINSALLFKNFLMQQPSALEHVVIKPDNTYLNTLVNDVPDLSAIAKLIFTVCDEEGNIREDTIPELRACRRRINEIRSSVAGIIKKYLDDPNYNLYWQSDLPTIREGRAVLPLKANYRGRIKGVVHEVSSSGSTVFLEPLEVVEKNNAIKREEHEYQQVLIRILRELTEKISASYPMIQLMEERITFLDTIYARSRFGMMNDCSAARFSPGLINLIEARHPLLSGKVIPLSVVMKESARVLIITGPNTGGKTVSLKTVGLLAMMNQFGMEIPAQEGSSLPVFDSVYADIGDEQSIEQSLSTFSGHIRTLGSIIRKSTSASLVLLDELGAGTDPEEGVAIAMAILDHLIDKGCMVLASTHHGILKNYGYSRDFVQNAAMEFDPSSLSPLYRMIIGIPGESYALAIAERHGIPAHIISNARHYLDDERTDISVMIKKLSEKQRELLEAEREQKVQTSELIEKSRATDLRELRLRQREFELKKHGIKELRDFLLKSRREFENMVREIREGKITKEQIAQVRTIFSSIEEITEKEETKLAEKISETIEMPDVEITSGMEVKVKSTGNRGRVIRKAKGDTWVIETESIKVTLRVNEFVPVKPEEIKPEYSGISTSMKGVESKPVFQLDVRGRTLDEAIAALEKQIDSAILSSLREFGIVHGKGDGILQQGIHRFLKTNSYVSDFYFSRPEEGGFGRTVVILKA